MMNLTRNIPEIFNPNTMKIIKMLHTIVYTDVTFNNTCIAIGFRTKKKKRDFYHSFSSEDSMRKYIINYDLNVKKDYDEKIAYKARKKSEVSSILADMKIGDIFYTTWGWEQTNIDFYQVININKSTVTFQQLDSIITETGFMCGDTVPNLNKPIGTPFTKRFTTKFCIFNKYTQKFNGKPLHCSWYA